MSARRRAVYDYIARGGRRGVKCDKILKELFPKNQSEVTLRTTIHYINKLVAPVKIIVKGGIVRLVEP